MLEFDRVAKTYDTAEGSVTAVSDLSFAVNPGECCCLLGPNGAGKTTSIMMLLGFLPLSAGDIRICGVSVRERPLEARKHVSYIPDDLSLYKNLTGAQNLRFFAELVGRALSDAECDQLGAQVGLAHAALHRKVGSYSKGMKQRLAIAVSLLKSASVYVLDEPTTGLDVLGIRELMDILRGLRRDGKTIIVTTHDLLHVNEFATQVLFLLGGKIQGTMGSAELATVNLENAYVELIQRAAG